MKKTANEKLLGIETMKARIELFHADRLRRIGQEWKMDYFRTAGWSRSKVIKEFRALPENIDQTGSVWDGIVPEPKTEQEMRELLANSRVALTLG